MLKGFCLVPWVFSTSILSWFLGREEKGFVVMKDGGSLCCAVLFVSLFPVRILSCCAFHLSLCGVFSKCLHSYILEREGRGFVTLTDENLLWYVFFLLLFRLFFFLTYLSLRIPLTAFPSLKTFSLFSNLFCVSFTFDTFHNFCLVKKKNYRFPNSV